MFQTVAILIQQYAFGTTVSFLSSKAEGDLDQYLLYLNESVSTSDTGHRRNRLKYFK
jgi:hypothetical protein